MTIIERIKHVRRSRPEAMTLVEHLAELRHRVIVTVAFFAVTATACFILYPQILHFLQEPYCQVTKSCKLYVTGPLDGLSIRVEIAVYGGALLALPVALYETWRFITPGLKANEKRYAIPFVLASVLLFCIGALIAYLTFPHALGWLKSIGGPSLREIYSPTSYLGLILALMAIFGICFEFPVVLVALELAGVLSPAKLSHWRRLSAFLIVAFAAIITPSSDPFSMFALAVPLYFFYEVSIVIGKLIARRRRKAAAAKLQA
ncbi:MAG: twin-arginine translocase subunit TatC [Actinobacteria bacterium]|nr:twin-arginine translocase subunit TatC [Actinomycetota bacterium]